LNLGALVSMANKTDPIAGTIHGTDPQYLVEKILRTKIYDHPYWKEHCFALTAETLVDKAVDLKAIGGTYGGNRKPTKFLCLLLKMLQIQPEKEIVVEFILNDDYKYVRILGALYLRLVGRPLEIYQYLEPLLVDYRKIRFREPSGKYVIKHVDEIVDSLLTEDYYFDIVLPRLIKRHALEEAAKLDPRESMLYDLNLLEAEGEGGKGSDSDSDDEKKKKKKKKPKEPKEATKDVKTNENKHETTDKKPTRKEDEQKSDAKSTKSKGEKPRSRSRDRSRDRERRRERSRERDRPTTTRRSRSRSRSRGRTNRRRRSRS